MYDVILIVVFLVGGLMTLAVLWPHPFDTIADPFSTPPNARPPWYLLAPHALLDLIPSIVPRFLRGLALVLLLAGVLFLPFLDRSGGTERRRKGFLILGIVVMVAWALLSWQGWYVEVSR
jgi:quinol-cytochrome oxidoreductase complex cytochrome b subunit